MNDLIHIDIKIADRTYPLKIKSADENRVKQAAEKINSQLKELREKYDARDMQDYLAMILMLQLNTVTSPATAEMTVNIDFSEQLKAIEHHLNDILK
jgi:cell division protein ZapA